MSIYRKIWSDHFGPIPKDLNSRSYEIHHIDGDRKNNDISNLKCITIEEHYEIHYSQGDWAPCMKIAQRMKMPPELISQLATYHNNKRVINGTNPFVGPEINRKRLENRSHHLLGGELQRKQVTEGIHNFVKDNPAKNKWKAERTHPKQNGVVNIAVKKDAMLAVIADFMEIIVKRKKGRLGPPFNDLKLNMC
jgi:hypothetical protein